MKNLIENIELTEDPIIIEENNEEYDENKLQFIDKELISNSKIE